VGQSVMKWGEMGNTNRLVITMTGYTALTA